MFHELVSRDHEDGRATRSAGACAACRGTVPRYRGIGPEAYLNGTSQGPTPEDARKDGHIRGRSKRFMKHPGYTMMKVEPGSWSDITFPG